MKGLNQPQGLMSEASKLKKKKQWVILYVEICIKSFPSDLYTVYACSDHTGGKALTCGDPSEL